MRARWGLLGCLLAWMAQAGPTIAGPDGPRSPAQQAGGQQQPPPGDPGRVLAPAATEQPPQPTFRTGINFVRVDVIVTDKKGEPVANLKQEDFEVFEDGKPQAIESFKLINVETTAETTVPRQIRSAFDEETEAQREDVRLFAFFLDDYHVRRGAAMRSREPLAKFVQQFIKPSDMVSIMYPLTPLSDVVMSRNHDALARALMTFDGRKYDYTPRNIFEEQYAYYPAPIVERIRNDISLSALKALIWRLGALREGRKALILVSEGYTNYMPPQMRDPIATMPGVGNPNRGAYLGEGQIETREQFFSKAEMLSDLREVYDTANRNNVAIYAYDPRGLAAFEHDINEGGGAISLTQDSDALKTTMETLQVLAGETDGRALVNSNDMEKGLRQIIKDSSAYYLLGYNSTRAPADGKFHEIKVRLKRSGLQIRARKGYWALTAAETARALAPPAPERPKEVDAALASIVEPPRGRLVRTWVGTSRGAGGRTKVTFVWEPAPVPPGVTRREEPARLNVMVMAADGSPVYRGRVPDVAVASTDGQAAMASAGGPGRGPARVVFDAPPGQVQLRFQVEDAGASTIDTDTREFAVPDLTAPLVLLSTPAVIRARNNVEFQQLAKDPNAIPVVGRDFRRTERLLIRWQAYGPGTEVPEVTARILNRAGTAMNDVAVSAPGGATAPDRQLDLALSGMAAGEYLVEIKAKGESGEAKQLVAFRVVS
jgi:VWFA-related protein